MIFVVVVIFFWGRVSPLCAVGFRLWLLQGQQLQLMRAGV